MESNDSPDIPDRKETSEEPGLPSGIAPQIQQAPHTSDHALVSHYFSFLLLAYVPNTDNTHTDFKINISDHALVSHYFFLLLLAYQYRPHTLTANTTFLITHW